MSPQCRHPWIWGATCSVEGLCPPHLVKGCSLAFVFPTLKLNAVVISYHIFTAIFLIVKLRKKWTYAFPKTQVLSISRKNRRVFFWRMWRISKQRMFTLKNYILMHPNQTSNDWYTERMGVEKLNGLEKWQCLFLNENKISDLLWNAVLY